MSETAGNASPAVTPRVLVSVPSDEAANRSGHRNLASRKRTSGPRPVNKEQSRSTSSEWIDVDDAPRRMRSSKFNSHDRVGSRKPSSDTRTRQRESEGSSSGFFPRLGRILEASESTTSSRTTTRGSDTRRQRESGEGKRTRQRNDTSSIHRRPVRHRTSGMQKRSDSLLKINPSLLSVLSSLTASSERSSGSGSTVTQQSYDRRDSDNTEPTRRKRRHPGARGASVAKSRSRSKSPDVFDYLLASTAASVTADEPDDQSKMSSSSSSQYEPSLAGSSEAPDTPSSRSTFPSPPTTRSQSVAELRRKYDPSFQSENCTPEPSIRSARKQPRVDDIIQDHEESIPEHTAPSEDSYEARQRSMSRSSRSSQHSNGRLRSQEEHMRQHMEYANHAQPNTYVDPAYVQHRSSSASSVQSDQAAYAYHMAMQQYQHPLPPVVAQFAATQQNPDSVSAQQERPPAPDAPELSRRTVAGYEMLALELSSAESPVKPLYRKFEYLNHRILLHLQDELCELEEQLRIFDEIIAQNDPALAEGGRSPASRRGETYSTSEIHHRRTSLLGRIFIKTEQYNKAMSSFTAMTTSSSSPQETDLQAYQQWMAKHAPIHEVEARFLQRGEDLMHPIKANAEATKPTEHVAFAYLPMVLMLPLLLFSTIPTLAGRLTVTALIAVGTFIVTATTQIRHALLPCEWAVCGAAYMLLMAAIAGCVPQHSS